MIRINSLSEWNAVASSRGLVTPPRLYPVAISDSPNETIFSGFLLDQPAYKWFAVVDGIKLRINDDKMQAWMWRGSVSLIDDPTEFIEVEFIEGDLHGQRVLVSRTNVHKEQSFL